MIRRLNATSKPPKTGPLRAIERQIIKKFVDKKPAKLIARLINQPVSIVREQIKLMQGNAREAEAAEMLRV